MEASYGEGLSGLREDGAAAHSPHLLPKFWFDLVDFYDIADVFYHKCRGREDPLADRKEYKPIVEAVLAQINVADDKLLAKRVTSRLMKWWDEDHRHLRSFVLARIGLVPFVPDIREPKFFPTNRELADIIAGHVINPLKIFTSDRQDTLWFDIVESLDKPVSSVNLTRLRHLCRYNRGFRELLLRRFNPVVRTTPIKFTPPGARSITLKEPEPAVETEHSSTESSMEVEANSTVNDVAQGSPEDLTEKYEETNIVSTDQNTDILSPCPSPRPDTTSSLPSVSTTKQEDSTITLSMKPENSYITIHITPKSLKPRPSVRNSNIRIIKPASKLNVGQIADAITGSVKTMSDVDLNPSYNSLSPVICKRLRKQNCRRNWRRLADIWQKNVGNIQEMVRTKLNEPKDTSSLELNVVKLQENLNEAISNSQIVARDLKLYRENMFDNGLFTCPDYYCNELSNVKYTVCVYSRPDMTPIKFYSQDYKSLFGQSPLSSGAIDGCVASVIRSFKQAAALQLTVFETFLLFNGAFSENSDLLHLNWNSFDFIILPYTKGDGHWSVLVVVTNSKEIYNYSTSPDTETASKSFVAFLGFLEKKNKIMSVPLDTKSWNCKTVKHSVVVQPFDSGIFLIGFIQSMLKKQMSLSLNPSKFRKELKILCLKSSDNMMKKCLICGCGDLEKIESFRCHICFRQIHFNVTCFQVKPTNVDFTPFNIDKLTCQLCKFF